MQKEQIPTDIYTYYALLNDWPLPKTEDVEIYYIEEDIPTNEYDPCRGRIYKIKRYIEFEDIKHEISETDKANLDKIICYLKKSKEEKIINNLLKEHEFIINSQQLSRYEFIITKQKNDVFIILMGDGIKHDDSLLSLQFKQLSDRIAIIKLT